MTGAFGQYHARSRGRRTSSGWQAGSLGLPWRALRRWTLDAHRRAPARGAADALQGICFLGAHDDGCARLGAVRAQVSVQAPPASGAMGTEPVSPTRIDLEAVHQPHRPAVGLYPRWRRDAEPNLHREQPVAGRARHGRRGHPEAAAGDALVTTDLADDRAPPARGGDVRLAGAGPAPADHEPTGNRRFNDEAEAARSSATEAARAWSGRACGSGTPRCWTGTTQPSWGITKIRIVWGTRTGRPRKFMRRRSVLSPQVPASPAARSAADHLRPGVAGVQVAG